MIIWTYCIFPVTPVCLCWQMIKAWRCIRSTQDTVVAVASTVNPEYFVCNKFSYAGDLHPFVLIKFSYSHWPLRILCRCSELLLRTLFSYGSRRVRNITKIKCTRIILDLQYEATDTIVEKQAYGIFADSIHCTKYRRQKHHICPKQHQLTVTTSFIYTRGVVYCCRYTTTPSYTSCISMPQAYTDTSKQEVLKTNHICKVDAIAVYYSTMLQRMLFFNTPDHACRHTEKSKNLKFIWKSGQSVLSGFHGSHNFDKFCRNHRVRWLREQSTMHRALPTLPFTNSMVIGLPGVRSESCEHEHIQISKSIATDWSLVQKSPYVQPGNSLRKTSRSSAESSKTTLSILASKTCGNRSLLGWGRFDCTTVTDVVDSSLCCQHGQCWVSFLQAGHSTLAINVVRCTTSIDHIVDVDSPRAIDTDSLICAIYVDARPRRPTSSCVQ